MGAPLIRRRMLLSATAVALYGRRAEASPTYQTLFRIERNKNANIVQYDAAVVAPDLLETREPVVAYWLLKAEDGRREALTALDRRAYGFKIAPERGGTWLLYMNATRDRSIRVLPWQGRWRSQIVIRGKSALLERMFVFADESAFVPHVRWIDLFGVDMVSGQPLTERLKP